MQPPHPHSRINLAELKAQIVKKLGPEGSNQYFYYLNRFLSLKLTKVEFNKLCVRIVGRENIPLHNQLIHSLLRNACSAKVPPTENHKYDVSKHGAQVSGKDVSVDGYHQNGSHPSMNQDSGLPGLSNGGHMLTLSTRMAGTGSYDQNGNRRTSLGSNRKRSIAPELSAATQSSDVNAVLENGDMHPPDIVKSVWHHQGLVQQLENESKTVRMPPDGLVSSCSKEQTELDDGDDRKEGASRSPLQAPIGVPFRPVGIGGVRRALPLASSNRFTGTLDDVLLDSLALRERMEQIAVAQGLEGMSLDSANILNHGLDSYMKGLIRSCIELVGARSGHELTKNKTKMHYSYMKLINGVRPGLQHQMQDSGRPLEVHEQKTQCPISLQDFRVSMELRPQKLGEDWPLLLEKICTHAFEE